MLTLAILLTFSGIIFCTGQYYLVLMLVFEATFNLTLLINTSFSGINLLSLTIYYAYTHALLTSRLVAILSDETTSPVNVAKTFLFFCFLLIIISSENRAL